MNIPHIVLFFHSTPDSDHRIEEKLFEEVKSKLTDYNSEVRVHSINTNNSITDTIHTATEFYGKDTIFITTELSNKISTPHPNCECVVFYYSEDVSYFDSVTPYKTQKLNGLFTSSDIAHQLYLVLNIKEKINLDLFVSSLAGWVIDLINAKYPQVATISPEEKIQRSYTVIAPGKKKILTHMDKYLCCKICDKYNGAKVIDYNGTVIYNSNHSKVHPITPGKPRQGSKCGNDLSFVQQLPRMK